MGSLPSSMYHVTASCKRPIMFTSSFYLWAFCTNWPHGTKSAILDGKRMWHPPLGHRKQRKVKLDRLDFLCVRICYILLPSSTADFTPCDKLVQTAHSRQSFMRNSNNNTERFAARRALVASVFLAYLFFHKIKLHKFFLHPGMFYMEDVVQRLFLLICI